MEKFNENKRLLTTNQYPEPKRRFSSGKYSEIDDEDIQIDIPEENLKEIVNLVKKQEKHDNRRAVLRGWPQDEDVTN